MGDTFFNPDPENPVGDVFQNVQGGDVWFDVPTSTTQDVAWDILNTWVKDTAWDILNSYELNTAWDILNTFTKNVAWDILNTFIKNTSWDILNSFDQDTAWDVLNTYTKDTAWDVLNGYDQDTAWSVFAKTLYFLQRFFIKQICFDFNIAEPVGYDYTIYNPLEFTYRSQGVINQDIYLRTLTTDTVSISEKQEFSFSIADPVDYTFLAKAPVFTGKTIYINPLCFDFAMAKQMNFNLSIQEPLKFNFMGTAVLDETIVLSTVSMDTIVIREAQQYDFQIHTPVDFTFLLKGSLDNGEQDFVKRN